MSLKNYSQLILPHLKKKSINEGIVLLPRVIDLTSEKVTVPWNIYRKTAKYFRKQLKGKIRQSEVEELYLDLIETVSGARSFKKKYVEKSVRTLKQFKRLLNKYRGKGVIVIRSVDNLVYGLRQLKDNTWTISGLGLKAEKKPLAMCLEDIYLTIARKLPDNFLVFLY